MANSLYKNIKRSIAILLVLITLVQVIPIYAETLGTEENPYIISTQEELLNIGKYAVNGKITGYFKLTNGFYIFSDYMIGNENLVFSGTLDGDGNGLVLRGETNKDKYGLFYSLENATIKNLSINFFGAQVDTTSKDVYVGGLAYKIKNSQLLNVSFFNAVKQGYYPGSGHCINAAEGYDVCEENKYDGSIITTNEVDNLYYGGAAAVLEGNNNIATKSWIDQSFSFNEKVKNGIGGGIVGIIKNGKTSITKGDSVNALDITSNIFDDGSNKCYGGVAGVVDSNAQLEFLLTSTISTSLKLSDNINKNYKNSTLTLGSIVGKIINSGSVIINNINSEMDISSLNNMKDANIGVVGEVDGKLEFLYSRSKINFVDKSNKYSISIENSNNLNIGNIAGNVGKNGNVISYSNGLNLGGNLTASNSNINIGIGIGRNSGNVDLADSGFYSNSLVTSKKTNEGYYIGYVESPEKVSVKYTMVYIPDEDGAIDYSIIDKPFGNLTNDSYSFKSFKNNYLGSLRFLEIGIAGPIIETVPMKLYGDNPPTSTSSDYPFLLTYEYYDYYNYGDKVLKSMTINNFTDKGISTIKMSSDVYASITIDINVIGTHKKPEWNGHLYRNADILNYIKNHPEEFEQDDSNGLSTAIIVGSINPDEPLPTFNSDSSSIVKFNYFDLPYDIVKNNFSFNDISNQKYKNDIIESANRLIVKGVGNNNFEPDRAITRAEFATMVIRALGLVPIEGSSFLDVNSSAWYYKYVNSAAGWEIIEGIGNNLYAPEKTITREEATTILIRAADNILIKNGFNFEKGYRWEDVTNNLSGVSNWAIDSVSKNFDYKIVSYRDGNFEPTSNITRAETANAILNMLKNFGVID